MSAPRNPKTAALEALVEAHATELKLPTVKARFRQLAAEATREQQTPVAYLAALLEAEHQQRAERRERRRLIDARFPLLKRLEEFRFADNPKIPQATIAALADGAWINDRDSIVLVGVLRLSSFPRSAVFPRHVFRRGRISVCGQTGPRRSMSGPQDAKRSGWRTRPLSAEEKYQIWQQLLTGELTQRQAAEQWNVDPTTIMRIRRVGREGALTALAQSKPGRRDGSGGQDAELAAARAEIARLEETVKEQAIELVALRGKTRSGW